MTPHERFWPKAEVGEDSECWPWVGSRDPYGYGRLKINGKFRGAHRLAYELSVGSIPEGLEIDHLCRNRCCVNPAHLEPVTHAPADAADITSA